MFELDIFLEVLRAYEIHVKVNFSFGLILRTLYDDRTTTYRYFHSSHSNRVMLGGAFRITFEADVMAFKDLFDTKGSLLIA